MGLQRTKLQLVGIAPLIMHNVQLANPLNQYTKALKKLTGKRQKTEADYQEIARLEWEGGLYLHNGAVVMPAQNIFACMIAGGKKSKRGVKIQTGVNVEEDFCALDYKGPKVQISGGNGDLPNPLLNKFYDHLNFQTMVTVEKKRNLRTRPLFHQWSLECTVIFDDTVLEKAEVVKVAEDAGMLVGLGDWRPRFGRFMVEELK